MAAGLSIGDIARRTGLAVSAIRFYEGRGLVMPWRDEGGRRRYDKSDLRRISFVMIAQRLGFSLREIEAELARLPKGRAPTAKDWAAISAAFRDRLDERIDGLRRLRDRLDGCIGCGCLSLKACRLHNRDDKVAAAGPGPRWLLDDPSD